MRKHKKPIRNLGKTRAKLIFDDGFAERPTHRITGFVTEKQKGISMLELIQSKFAISEQEFKDAFKRKLSEWQKEAFTPTSYKRDWVLRDKPSKLTRDERGNLVSPFASEPGSLHVKKSEQKDNQP